MVRTFVVDKFDALGNDFLVLDLDAAGLADDELDWATCARAWCARAGGVGADGLLLLRRIDERSARMRLVNSDGSHAEMSGNGARCFAHALYRSDAAAGGANAGEYVLHTAAGPRAVTVRGGSEPDTADASVEMGVLTTIAAPASWSGLGVHPDRPVEHVSVGNPHAVVGVDDVRVVDLESLGRKVPEVNLEVIEPGPESDAITMRVHERGAGITQACGTGACASAWAAVRWGLVAGGSNEVVSVTVHMPGGDARVTLNAPRTGECTLGGESRYVGRFEVVT
ncbi:MAG: diaminopimelate epimerase [Ilumatobacteraceae bacterium]